MGGMFTLVGPPIVTYYDSIIDDSIEYQATTQTFFFFTCIILFINNILYVKLTSHLLLLAFMAIGGCLIGTYIGTKILQKISMKIVRRFAYIINVNCWYF